MNEAIKQENIEKKLNTLGIEPDNNYLYAVKYPLGIWWLPHRLSVFMIKHYVIVFTKKDIVLIPVNIWGDFIEDKSPTYIPRETVDIRWKNGIVMNSLILKSNGKKQKYFISNVTVGIAWQKDHWLHLSKTIN